MEANPIPDPTTILPTRVYIDTDPIPDPTTILPTRVYRY